MTKLTNLLVQRLAPKLAEYFPAYANKHQTPEAITFSMREYARHLIELKIGTNMISVGMKRAEKRDFCPNPFQFAKLCLPTTEDLMLPSIDDTFREINQRYGQYRHEEFTYSHRLIELISERIGPKIYTMKEADARELLENAYNYWIERAKQGDLPEPRKAIPLIVPTEPMVDMLIRTKGLVLVEDDEIHNRILELQHQARQQRENKTKQGDEH